MGDLVAFRHPLEPGAEALKRVVGMPGDFVCTGGSVRREPGMIQVCACFVLRREGGGGEVDGLMGE